MIEFLLSSKSFAGFTFDGLYNMNPEILKKLWSHYVDTGENLLDDYSFVFTLNWEDEDEFIRSGTVLDYEQYNSAIQSIGRVRRLKLFDGETISNCTHICKVRHNRFLWWESRKINEPRKKAGTYISKLSVRKSVFNKYGKKCLCCGSVKKIQIDHVISVYNGGKNEISNLQPLCKSCNVRKGTSNTDYRKEVVNG